LSISETSSRTGAHISAFRPHYRSAFFSPAGIWRNFCNGFFFHSLGRSLHASAVSFTSFSFIFIYFFFFQKKITPFLSARANPLFFSRSKSRDDRPHLKCAGDLYLIFFSSGSLSVASIPGVADPSFVRIAYYRD